MNNLDRLFKVVQKNVAMKEIKIKEFKKLFKNAKKDAAIREKEMKEFEKMITHNSQMMYLETMEELINEYKKNPFDANNEIEFNVPLIDPTNLTDMEEYYLKSQKPLNPYLMYYENSKERKKDLVEIKTLRTIFISSGINSVTLEKPESDDKNNYYNLKIKFTPSKLRDGIIKLAKDYMHVGQIFAIKTLLETRSQERNYFLFHEKIKKNNDLMLVDINRELVEQYQKNPLDEDEVLTVKKELRSGLYTSDETEKYYVSSMSEYYRENYFLYDRPNSDKPLLIYYNNLNYDLQSEGIENISLHKIESNKDCYIIEVRIPTYKFEEIIKEHTKKKIFK